MRTGGEELVLVCSFCFEQRSGRASLSKPGRPAEAGSGRVMPSAGCLRDAAGALLGGGGRFEQRIQDGAGHGPKVLGI